MELTKNFILYALHGKVGHQGEKEDKQRGDGREKGVGEAFGSLPQGSVGNAGEEETQHIPHGYTFTSGERGMLEKIDSASYRTKEEVVGDETGDIVAAFHPVPAMLVIGLFGLLLY